MNRIELVYLPDRKPYLQVLLPLLSDAQVDILESAVDAIWRVLAPKEDRISGVFIPRITSPNSGNSNTLAPTERTSPSESTSEADPPEPPDVVKGVPR